MNIILCFLFGLVGICVLGLIWCQFMLIRNAWVYRVRTRLLHADMGRYDKLVSYEEMLRRFWIWDIERFIGQ